MDNIFSVMFSYSFIVRALIVGSLVSLCASLLGVNLVLKRYSMIGDGLAHVGFASLSIALVMNKSPLLVSIPVVIIVAFFLIKIKDNSKIKGDSAVALVSSSALAIGIIIPSISNGVNVDISSYMFGSILAISRDDVIISIILSILVLILYIIFYKPIFAVTFDENYARASGLNTDKYNMLISILTAIIIVVGMRIMGTLLISSLIIFPAITSMQIFDKFKSVVISSAIISIVCFFLGITISFMLSFPAGASIVVINLFAFIIFSLISRYK